MEIDFAEICVISKISHKAGIKWTETGVFVIDVIFRPKSIKMIFLEERNIERAYTCSGQIQNISSDKNF